MAKKKVDFNKIIMNSAKAAGGGIVAAIATDKIIEGNPEMLEKNKYIAEILPMGLGVATLYFAPEEWHAAAYGMIGAGAAGFSDDIMDKMEGFQRVNYMNGHIADEMNAGLEYIDKMEGLAFEDVEVVTDDEEMD